MAFETLVRPFAEPRPLGTQRVPIVVTQVPPEDATLTWGKPGILIVPQEVIPPDLAGSSKAVGFQIRDCNSKSTETSRKTVTQRVKNPEDESQYVDLQVPQQISFSMKPDKSLLHSRFNTETTTWADNDPIYSAVTSIVDPPDQEDVCQQSLAFKATATSTN